MPQLVTTKARTFNRMDRTSGIENLPPTTLYHAENVRFNRDSGVYTRLGIQKLATLGTGAKIDNMETQTEFACMFCKSNTGIYQSLDGITWYSIGVTRTATERDRFHDHDLDMFATNQTDAYLRIACSVTTDVVDDTDVVITVKNIDQFDASGGTVYIRGDSIAYTGVNVGNKTLTGVTGIVSGGHPSGAIVTETSTPASSPKGRAISGLEGSNLVGGTLDKPSVLYYSDAATLANPEKYYAFSGGASGSKLMKRPITALKESAGVVIIGMKKGIDYAYGFDTTTNALLTRTISDSEGIPNQECIVDMDGILVAYTGNRVLPIQASVDSGAQIIEDPNDPRTNFDYEIAADLQMSDEDQSGSYLDYDRLRRELVLSCSINGQVRKYVKNKDTGAWSFDTGKPFGCSTFLGGRRYAGSAASDKIYKDNSTTTDDGIPIFHRILSGVMGIDQELMTAENLLDIFGGLLSGAGSFKHRIYVDNEQYFNEEFDAVSLEENGHMKRSGGIPVGGGNIGAETIGFGDAAPDAFRFTLPIEILLIGERIQFEWEIFSEGTAFELRKSRLVSETEGELELSNF